MKRLTTFSKFLITLALVFTGYILISGIGCSPTDEQGAKEALINAGYHPISVGGYGLFKCSEDDFYATKFKAYSPDSTRIVTGCVCQGFLKGKTIRLD